MKIGIRPMQTGTKRVIDMTDNEFIFYWFATFFIWNIYYLYIVPKRSAEFWGQRFKSELGQEELVIIGESIIQAVIERSSSAFEESLDEFKTSLFGSLGANIKETKSVLNQLNPEGKIIEEITKDNPLMGLIVNRLAPQFQSLMGNGGQGVKEGSNSFKKGL